MRFSSLFSALAVAGLAVATACSTTSPLEPGPDGGAQPDGAAPDATAEGGTGADAGADGGGGTDAGADGGGDAGTDAQAAFTLTSTAFVDGGKMALKYANGFCTPPGSNLSPPLAWSGAPAGTMTFALVMRDVTLGGSDNFHWTIFDIPAGTSSLPEGVAQGAAPAVPAGSKQIADSFAAGTGYLGPCPPAGSHDYVFTLYALNVAQLPTPIVSNPPAYESTIKGAAIAQTTLRGVYP